MLRHLKKLNQIIILRLYDIISKYKNRKLEISDYIDFMAEFDKRVIIHIRKKVLEDKLGKTDDQCGNIGNPKGKCCYICGYIINSIEGKAVTFIDKKSNKTINSTPLGSQCEHMVSVSELASLVGLYGNDYIKSMCIFFFIFIYVYYTLYTYKYLIC